MVALALWNQEPSVPTCVTTVTPLDAGLLSPSRHHVRLRGGGQHQHGWPFMLDQVRTFHNQRIAVFGPWRNSTMYGHAFSSSRAWISTPRPSPSRHHVRLRGGGLHQHGWPFMLDQVRTFQNQRIAVFGPWRNSRMYRLAFISSGAWITTSHRSPSRHHVRLQGGWLHQHGWPFMLDQVRTFQNQRTAVFSPWRNSTMYGHAFSSSRAWISTSRLSPSRHHVRQRGGWLHQHGWPFMLDQVRRIQ